MGYLRDMWVKGEGIFTSAKTYHIYYYSLQNIHLDFLRTKQIENSFTDLHHSCADKKGKGGRERKARGKERRETVLRESGWKKNRTGEKNEGKEMLTVLSAQVSNMKTPSENMVQSYMDGAKITTKEIQEDQKFG